MKKATALKTFRDSETGQLLKKGATIKGEDSRIGELKAAGLVEKVRDVTAEENEAEAADMQRSAMLNAVLEDGSGPRVVIGFRNAAEAGAFRAAFAEGQAAALASEKSGEPAPPRTREIRPAKGRETKPAPPPLKKPEPEPGAGAGPGAASADDTSVDPDATPPADPAAPPPPPGERPKRGNRTPDAA